MTPFAKYTEPLETVTPPAPPIGALKYVVPPDSATPPSARIVALKVPLPETLRLPLPWTGALIVKLPVKLTGPAEVST